MSDYFILRGAQEDEFCRIREAPADLPSLVPVKRGESMLEAWPGRVELQMARRHPGLQVPDVVANSLRCLIVSDRLKSILEEHVAHPVEYLPIVLLDHKGRVADDSMWIVNLLDTVACTDVEQTEGSESAFHPGEFQDLLELHVHADRIPTDRKMFRLAECPATILVRDDLRAILDAAEITADYHDLGEMIL